MYCTFVNFRVLIGVLELPCFSILTNSSMAKSLVHLRIHFILILSFQQFSFLAKYCVNLWITVKFLRYVYLQLFIIDLKGGHIQRIIKILRLFRKATLNSKLEVSKLYKTFSNNDKKIILIRIKTSRKNLIEVKVSSSYIQISMPQFRSCYQVKSCGEQFTSQMINKHMLI